MMILVTGGAGFIGSHTCVELLAAGYEVAVIDNLSNSKAAALDRVEQIAGKPVRFYHADILDRSALDRIFEENGIDSVIHFAGLKAVGESVRIPLRYYHNNISGAITLLSSMAAHGVKKIVFSSSATVYGDPAKVPITEDMPLSATNPYGRTKLMIEEILRDLSVSDPEWSISLLRYFNPAGAHPTGLIGENPNGIPNNLMPRIIDAARGRTEAITVYGDDYPTPDGTGVRDYIHVVDLALGHIRVLELLAREKGVFVHNLGTGRGYSVLELIGAFERACGTPIRRVVTPRRAGDVAACYADPGKAQRELGWRAGRSLDDMCRDSWNWAQKNPCGYPD